MESDGLIKKSRCQSRLSVQITRQGCAFIKSLYIQLDRAFRMTEGLEIANEHEPDIPSQIMEEVTVSSGGECGSEMTGKLRNEHETSNQ